MNWIIIIIEIATLVLIFTAAIMIPLIKNPVWWIHDYPKDIQDRYFDTHERIPARFFSDKVLAKKGVAVILSYIAKNIFAVIGLVFTILLAFLLGDHSF